MFASSAQTIDSKGNSRHASTRVLVRCLWGSQGRNASSRLRPLRVSRKPRRLQTAGTTKGEAACGPWNISGGSAALVQTRGVRRQTVVTGCDIRWHRIPPAPGTGRGWSNAAGWSADIERSAVAPLHQQEASGPDGPMWLLTGKAEAGPRGRQADQRPVEASANPQASRTSRTKRKDKP
jgi:hypothetical protein